MSSNFKGKRSVISAAAIMLMAGHAAHAQEAADNSGLLDLSLQQLSDIEVTSVSKKGEKASQAAAAIYVITQEDIRRSGLQSLPELLRMVPGLQVAQSGSNSWSITSRGFNGQFANKLLVLIDGRTVYTPIFSGVFWDMQNTMLADIERIEVIRGPGATLWGANAVNGVINIITKSAKDTQGALVSATAGTQERVAGEARYGGRKDDLYYRTYAKYFDRDEETTVANSVSGATRGGNAKDDWQNAQGGFRLDWGSNEKEQKTLQADIYDIDANAKRYLPVTGTVSPTYFNVVNDVENGTGMNMLGRIKHELAAGSDITLQAYYDTVSREYRFIGSKYRTQTIDFDFQHNWVASSRHDITWGLGYRYIDSKFSNGFYLSFTPEEDMYESLYSGFVQDKITLIPDTLHFTLGTKLEHNDFSGFEWEPSARMVWTPTATQTLWGAISRAVRTPNQGDQNSNILLGITPDAPDQAIFTKGQASATSNIVVTYELGYRIQPRNDMSFDLTGFINHYRNLDSTATGSASVVNDPFYGTYLYIPLLNTSDANGNTRGLELAATWEATRYAKLSAGYTLFSDSLNVVGSGTTTASGTSPTHQLNLRSYVDLPHDVQWDTMAYYVGRLGSVVDGFGNSMHIPAYVRLDMRLGWEPVDGLELNLIGHNLLQSHHQEFSPFLYQSPEEISRSVLAKVTARF